MNTIKKDPNLVAYCGLYCGACRQYIKGKCVSCKSPEKKADWCKLRNCCIENRELGEGSLQLIGCKLRNCCIENKYQSCADCGIEDVNTCKKFNNFISKIFAFIFKSDRRACINNIRAKGYENHANEMAESGKQSMKK